ncbi:hypothetical protein AVEN_32050-1 [Araneus ventricosus]|uniref:Uncharacterized protein n=1 Tax=Araneus ventricosus TaxID=182803 RepID=A0A4Y2BIH6_ARAVE|nr:hypothetical protein AVEN_14931-1 [Araneus ventricosus]GBL90983.1 hypothetical protein AVEN_32050-1 [Araneus ventricosus]
MSPNPLLQNRQKFSTNWDTFKYCLIAIVNLSLPCVTSNTDFENEVQNLTQNIIKAYNDSSRPLKPHEEFFLPPHVYALKTERNHTKMVYQRLRDPASKNAYHRAQARFRTAVTKFNQSSYIAETSRLNISDPPLERY